MPRKRKKKRPIPREAYALAAIVAFWIAGYLVVQWRNHLAEQRVVAIAEAKLKERYGWTEFAAVEIVRQRSFLLTIYRVVLVRNDPKQTIALVTVFNDSVLDVEVARRDGTE